jgi:predicted protein tyrosine phosphatase
MPFIQVCSLARLQATVTLTRASHVLTLINEQTPVPRPREIGPDNHLFLGMSDIIEPLDGHIEPAEAHVNRLLTFVRGWSMDNPMVVHCYAGVSRSTAAALISVAALRPDRPEKEIADLIRERSPTATPNLRLIAIADKALGRSGRLFHAAESIGRGADCFEGVPFKLEL